MRIHPVIGPKLQTLRKAAKRTQQDVADALGVHRVTVAEIEAARRPVLAHEILKLAKFLKFNLSTFAKELEAADGQ